MSRPAGPKRHFALTLYVAGSTYSSLRAVQQVGSLSGDELGGTVALRVVDVNEHPDLAAADAVVVTPTLVKRLPKPTQHFVGGNLAKRLLEDVVAGSAPTEQSAPTKQTEPT